MEKHLKRCAKRPQTSIENGSSDADERMSMMEENLMFMRKSLNEEIQMRHEIIDELGSLKRRNQVRNVNEKWDRKLYGKFSFLDYRRVDSKSQWGVKFAAEKDRRGERVEKVRNEGLEWGFRKLAEGVPGKDIKKSCEESLEDSEGTLNLKSF